MEQFQQMMNESNISLNKKVKDVSLQTKLDIQAINSQHIELSVTVENLQTQFLSLQSQIDNVQKKSSKNMVDPKKMVNIQKQQVFTQENIDNLQYQIENQLKINQ